MNKYVLVTVVSGSDPIRGEHDGPILHIIRKYCPERVVLILSKEFADSESKYHHNERAISMLREKLGIACESEIEDTGIVSADNYDELIMPFLKICNRVRDEYPEHKILLNISSGTPQMQAVMCLIGISDSLHYIPVQVPSPEKRGNQNQMFKPEKDDLEEWFEINLDNEKGTSNRCQEPALMNFKRPIIQFEIESLIQNYDYAGAWQLYEENRTTFSEQAGILLEHAKYRLNLNKEKALALAKKADTEKSLYLIGRQDISLLVEFFNSMKVKQYRGELNDFSMRLEIMTEYLAIHILEKNFGIKLDEICTVRNQKKSKIYYLSEEKCKSRIPGVIAYLNAYFAYTPKKRFNWGMPLNSQTVVLIVAFLGKDTKNQRMEDIAEEMLKWVDTVGKIRNPAAHTIISITEDTFKEVYGKTSDALCKKMQNVLRLVFGNEAKEEAFEIYDRINVMIREALEQ